MCLIELFLQLAEVGMLLFGEMFQNLPGKTCRSVEVESEGEAWFHRPELWQQTTKRKDQHCETRAPGSVQHQSRDKAILDCC